MTTQEFSDAFDTLLNSYNIQANFGEGASKAEITLDEYEKSVILTQAQDLIVKSYFYSNQNPQGQGFDDSARRQVDFSSLIKTANLDPVEYEEGEIPPVFDDRGIIYQMPKKKDAEGQELDTTDVLYILNEKLIVIKDNAGVQQKIEFVIVPLNYKEYDREMSKAYSQPLKKQAWRLFQNQSTEFDVQSELIPIWNISDELKDEVSTTSAIYRIRYVKRPDPIILASLPNGLTIDGFNDIMECKLNPILHMDILNKAVEIAITTRGGGTRIPQESQRGNGV